jgi:hypothetical protein
VIDLIDIGIDAYCGRWLYVGLGVVAVTLPVISGRLLKKAVEIVNRAGFFGGLFPREDGAHGTTE